VPETTTLFVAVSAAQGPGNTLRTVLVVSLVGAALLAWFPLRGYRDNDHND
jgi:ABC-type microcin C transport system permease subunit YejB